jgi:hypothetical protein
MPVGEFIAEIGCRILLEIILYGFCYWTGYILLSALSFGRLQLAPFSTIEERNRKKGKKCSFDWSIWLHRPQKSKVLKAEATTCVGALVWAAIGLTIFLITDN